jgi:hypothetical protein
MARLFGHGNEPSGSVSARNYQFLKEGSALWRVS